MPLPNDMPPLLLPVPGAAATEPDVVVSSTDSSFFLALAFSGKPLCLVLAKSSASLFFMVLATLPTSLLAGFSPFCAACTMPMKRCCFLLTAFSATGS